MNHSVNPTPTLLVLTAPAPEPARSEQDAPVFAEELSAAAGPSKEPRDGSGEESVQSEEPQAEAASELGTQGAEAEASDETSDETVDAGTDDGSIEDTLLAVTLVSETIVAETSPNATLPDHAATTVSVGLAAQESTPTETPLSDAALPSTQTKEAPTTPEEFAVGSIDEAVDLLPEVETDPELTLVEGAEASDKTQQAGNQLLAEVKPSNGAADPAPYESQASPSAQSSEAIKPVDQATGKLPDQGGGEPVIEPQPGGTAASAPQETSAEAASEASSSQENAHSREAAPNSASPTVEALKGRAEAARPGATDPLPTVDPARFVNRVSKAIETAHERGGGPIEIRLSPPELGSLRVQIEMKEGVLSASLEAETPAARNTLLDNLPALRERLEQQQIRLEKFDVDVRDDSQQRGGGGAPEGDTQRRPDDSPDRREPAAERRAERESTTTESERTVATITFEDDGLNLVA